MLKNKIASYKNGNVYVTIYNDGTKERFTFDDEYRPEFAENIDIKITDKCDMNCPMCHEGSSELGRHGNINEAFLKTLHPYQEVALGGGNIFSLPDFLDLLFDLRSRRVITNITVNQRHFLENYELIKTLSCQKLVYGIGVSLVNPTEEFINRVKQIPNAVIHVINGIFDSYDYESLKDNNLKLLILGYKEIRRGADYFEHNNLAITFNQNWLSSTIGDIVKSDDFNTVSFDNLAIEQLQIKRYFTPEQWSQFYMGDDGSSTFYIDMVNRQFAQNSTAPMDKRYDLTDSVDEMFKAIAK